MPSAEPLPAAGNEPPAGAALPVVVDCSGVGPGGITRVLTEIVRHWPGPLRLVAVPEGWEIPAGAGAEVTVLSRQGGGRERTIAAATAALRRATAEPVRVLSLSPSLAIVGSRLPVTTMVHDLAFRLWPHGLSKAVQQYRRVSYATAISRSARLVCVSARTRHDLLGLYGVDGGRTRLWHPGSDLAAPGELPAGLGGEFLVVAGHSAHKGVELAIEALEQLPAYTLVVLTGGNRIAAFTDAASGSAAADRIVFLDRLSEAAYAATLAGAAAFLMPSHFEGYGLPVAEALALGTPTVISPDPALLEATGSAAVRMTSWTASALVSAVEEARRPVTGAGSGRSWRVATEELAAGLTL